MNAHANTLGPSTAALAAQQRADRFGARIAACLSESAQAAPHDINERLRVARLQALERRKREPAPFFQSAHAIAHGTRVAGASGGAAHLSMGGGSGYDTGWLTRALAWLPLLALVAGLFAIDAVSTDNRARELAEVDAALLTDDLPPDAFIDPGFAQYVKQHKAAE